MWLQIKDFIVMHNREMKFSFMWSTSSRYRPVPHTRLYWITFLFQGRKCMIKKIKLRDKERFNLNCSLY